MAKKNEMEFSIEPITDNKYLYEFRMDGNIIGSGELTIKPNWISAKTRLPKFDGDYLVYGESYYGAIIKDCDWFDSSCKDWWNYPHNQITHWMPLPDSPEVE